MTKSVFSKTLAALVAVALVAGSTISSAEAKDGRRTAAILGALAGIAGVLVEASAGQIDNGHRPARPHGFKRQRFAGENFNGNPFPGYRHEMRGPRFDGHKFSREDRRDHGFKKDRGPRTRIGHAWCSNPSDC
jgi:hypothetical protein